MGQRRSITINKMQICFIKRSESSYLTYANAIGDVPSNEILLAQ